MRRYDSYKDSGVEWIGEIPSGWNVTKLKYTKKDSKNSFIDGDWIESKDLSDSGIRYITSGNIGEGKYKEQGSGYISEDTFNELNCTELFEGELVISRLFLPVGRSCILPNLNNRVITCVDNVVLRPKDSFNKFYLNYQFNSSRYSEFTELISRGVTLTRISRGMLGNNSIVVPPLSEQQQIVSFLDIKTSLIDSLIEKTQLKIELLKENRTSLINEVVTKGLNPNVEMKDSGVEWIGEIPSQWEKKKIGYVSKLFTGNPWKSELFNFENGIKIVRGENVSEGFLRWGSRTRFWVEPVEEDSIFYLKDGDIVIGMDGSKVGKNYVRIKEGDLPLLLHQRMCRIRVSEGYSPKFIEYWIGSEMFRFYIDISKTDPMIPHITQKNIFDFQIPFPSLPEQLQIVSYLDEHTQLIDKTISVEERRIDTLKEYRQSLISEVVTGKRKVVD
jgi:type I restriction enzyme S subunit